MKNLRIKNLAKNKKGMTLVECVAAMAIISIVAVCMVGGFVMMANLDRTATDRSRSDQGLERTIAQQDAGEMQTAGGTQSRSLPIDAAIQIPIQSQRHTDGPNGRGYTVFDFDAEAELGA